MVELKSLTAPKVAIPIVGLIVLLVVSTLVAIFYIRNPGVTDSIFGTSTEEPTTPASFSMQSADGEMEHLQNSSPLGQSAHQTPTTTAHDLATTTSSSPISTTTSSPVTQPSQQLSTPLHPIEPTQHLK